MAHVTVSIAGRTYRMACGEGEEAHLAGLAARLDARVGQMRGDFGEIGDMRLHVMAALTLCDELDEARARLGRVEAELAALAGVEEARAAGLAEGLVRAAERIERLTQALASPARAGPVANGAREAGSGERGIGERGAGEAGPGEE